MGAMWALYVVGFYFWGVFSCGKWLVVKDGNDKNRTTKVARNMLFTPVWPIALLFYLPGVIKAIGKDVEEEIVLLFKSAFRRSK